MPWLPEVSSWTAERLTSKQPWASVTNRPTLSAKQARGGTGMTETTEPAGSVRCPTILFDDDGGGGVADARVAFPRVDDSNSKSHHDVGGMKAAAAW